MKNLIRLWILTILFNSGLANGVGSYPIPNITDVSFTAQVSYDPVTDRFTYLYNIASGTNNQGDISYIYIDIKREGFGYATPPSDFHFSVPTGLRPTAEKMQRFENTSSLPFKTTIETVGTDLPLHWSSGPTGDGYLILTPPSGGLLDDTGVASRPDLISPGESFTGLTVTALSAPTLREVIIYPDWMLLVADEEALTDVIIDQANQIQQDILIRMTTIGPEFVNYTGHGLHDRLVKDIDTMVVLGWVTDLALSDSVRVLLDEAKAFLLTADGTQAKVKYQQALDLMTPVTETQMRREAIDLITVILKLRLQFVADTTVRIEPDMILAPEDVTLEIGETASIIPKIVDRARNDEEIGGFHRYTLEVLNGPNAGLIIPEPPQFGGARDDQLNYQGNEVGTDIVKITRLLEDDPLPLFEREARVIWTGGADYVISFFSPPFLDYQGSATIWIYEETKNIGTTDGKALSNTRYYLSTTADFDIASAYQLLERSVVPLAVDAESKSGAIELTWPSQFPPGPYFFAACVDANNVVAELNEDNNCSFHQVDRVAYVVGVMRLDDTVVNVPPSCDQAVASPDTLWPPNHKFENINIEGVIDVDQDAVLVTITGITQDEPVESISSGSTSPDGKGVGTAFAQVRAERDGTGDGRVYAIHFKAADSAGNECTGVVNTSSVVHDQSNRSLPAIDNGQVYDSTLNIN